MSGWVKTLDAMVEYSIHPRTQVVLSLCSENAQTEVCATFKR